MNGLAVVLATALESILRERYDDFQLLELDTQGECSYTALLITTTACVQQTKRIIQAREARFALDLDIAEEASRVYGHLAPSTSLLATRSLPTKTGQQTFHFYELDLIPGIPYSNFKPRRAHTDDETIKQQRILVGHLARFFARGWDGQITRPYKKGKVGSKITSKIEQLSKELPTPQLRTVAEWALSVVPLLDNLPVVLTHGDIVPSNIMVHPDSGQLRGMVDWVEAEFLPFGLAFYGLEYLLGFPTKRRDSMTDTITTFTYYDCAPQLREHFWSTLYRKIPELQSDAQMLKALRVAKIVGTLLWFGFAWDSGAVDRVVTVERDLVTLKYLEAFLFAEIDAWENAGGSPPAVEEEYVLLRDQFPRSC
jgi:hypothetical protein